MAPAKLLLLQALLFSLLLLIVPSHGRVVPAYTRPTIRQATNTICGMTAGLLHRRIQCMKFPESSAVVPSLPRIRPSIFMQDLCGASVVVCKKSDTGATEPCQFSSEFLERLRALSNTVWKTLLHKRWLIHAILGILFFIFCVGGFLSCRVYCCGVIEDDLPVPTFPDMKNVLVISFNEIQLITNNFRERIGSGAFGAVFLGQLSNNGRQVAVKHSNTWLVLLPILLVSLLLLMVPSHCKVMPSISLSSNTSYGITAGSGENHIILSNLLMSDDSTAIVQYPRVILPGTACVPADNYCSGFYYDSGYLCGEMRVVCNYPNDGTPSCKSCDEVKDIPQDPSPTTWQTLPKVDPTSATPSISQASSTVPEFRKPAGSKGVVQSLPDILPGVSVIDETHRSSAVYPVSGDQRDGSGAICKKSDTAANKGWSSYANILLLGIILFISLRFCCCRGWFLSGLNGIVPHEINSTDRLVSFSSGDLANVTNRITSRVRWGSLSDGRLVAAKWYDSPLIFRREMEMLSVAQHNNIVNLIGRCTEDNKRRLVFHFVSLRNLHGHIHPEIWQTGSSLFYTWKHRVKVLHDVAMGIKYLHNNAEQPIIHRDIRPANILIDENWVAKISGFTMAVPGPEPGRNYVRVERPAGTPGYMDPECHNNSERAAPCNDVFSFGVVMLEMITGREVIEETKWLANIEFPKNLLREVTSLLDRRIPTPKGIEIALVCEVLLLAQRCVMTYHQRPAISTVVTKLGKVLKQFDPSEASTS